MKKILFIIVFILVSFHLYPQSYIYNFKDGRSSLHLSFNQNRYEISFTKHITEDFIVASIFSSGNYTKNDNLLILKDDKCGFEMIFRKEDSIILPENKCPIFLADKRLILFLHSATLHEELDKLEQDYDIKSTNNQSEILDIDTSEKKINCGRYSNYNWTSIHINKDGSYVIRGEFYKISEGKWKEKGNIIEFYDEYLKFTFKGIKLVDNRIQITLPESRKNIFKLTN
jgi:hypothetical protein